VPGTTAQLTSSISNPIVHSMCATSRRTSHSERPATSILQRKRRAKPPDLARKRHFDPGCPASARLPPISWKERSRMCCLGPSVR
jgi:hypothetical protein